MSSFVIATAPQPESSTAVRATTASNHPVLRGRPVEVPYSLPRSRRRSPVASWSSVGKGPAPTRLEYAFRTTRHLSRDFGGRCSPPANPAEVHVDDVTNG